MPNQRRTQVIVVGGALAIASVAYGLGSQAGDGTAVADSQDGERGVRIAFERGGPCGFSGLADELGVDDSKLEQALRDFRSNQDDDMRDGFAADLADALGISEDKVSSALDKLHAQREDRFERMAPRDLPPPPGGVRFHFGAPLRGLAHELGVTRSELRKALREVGEKAGDRFEEHRRELAEFLADRLNLDVDKVLEALPAEGPRLRSMHPPGLPDHP
jgi:Clp amino terminal domain, pathogenicity island component